MIPLGIPGPFQTHPITGFDPNRYKQDVESIPKNLSFLGLYLCRIMAIRLYNRQNRKELKERFSLENDSRIVLSFYRYAHIEEPPLFRNQLYEALDQMDVKGRIYIAREGINGQISISRNNLDVLRKTLDDMDILRHIRLNTALEHRTKSFFALIIKVRDKIVADGIEDPGFDATQSGTHLNAMEFNQLAQDPLALIVDMRNHYESEVGHFKNAILPEVTTFREALPLVRDQLMEKKDYPIIMYCTGGIRCEKASAYLLHHGFKEVYQLDGGIIKYAHDVIEQGLPNYFIGKNFVFDERLGERISQDIIARCHQCGDPCDEHTNCANDACHILFIQCNSCAEKYSSCCSQKCAGFIKLDPEEQKIKRKTEQFNGSKFSKGRYKAHHKNELEPLK